MLSTDIREMTRPQHDRWLEAWQHSGANASPFLHPAYARAVGRAGVPVVVAMDAEQQGFLPLQCAGRRAIPVGGRLADFCGAIWPRELPFNGLELLEACGLQQWVLPNSIGVVADTGITYNEVMSPHIDLSKGFEGWLSDMQQHSSSIKQQTLRKSRKLEREVGTLRLDSRGGDAQLLEQLLRWKGDQRRESGSIDLFLQPWARALAADISTLAEDNCHGTLDALYAGDSLLAVHLGLRAGNRLHWWVPVYNEAFARYSPGMVMLFELAKRAQNEGVTRIDLGPGSERYKTQVANGGVPVRKSTLHRAALGRAMLQLQEGTYRRIHGTALASSLKRAQREWRKRAPVLLKKPQH